MAHPGDDDCDHELEVFEVDPDGNPLQRCRCGRVVEHQLVDGEDGGPTSEEVLARLLEGDTCPEQLFDTDLTELREEDDPC
jgi:hypothetical protein